MYPGEDNQISTTGLRLISCFNFYRVLCASTYVTLYETDFPEFKKMGDTAYKLTGGMFLSIFRVILLFTGIMYIEN